MVHAVALQTGVYTAQMRSGGVWLDNVLHMCVGAGFGLLWLWVVGKLARHISLFWKVFTTVVFVVTMAVAWEVLEVGLYLYFKTHALGITVYPPTWREAIFDGLSNVVGVSVLLVVMARNAGKEAVTETPQG